MSRVRKPNKYVNSTKYDSSITNISKKTRIHFDGENYHNAKTLSQWLFLKYDMTYKTFKNKSKNRKDELREEFKADTGIELKKDFDENDFY